MRETFDFDRLLPEQQSNMAKRIAFDNLSNSNDKYPVSTPAVNFYSKFVKRGLDIILSFIAIVVTLPINLLIAVVTLFDVGLPLFFKQKRIGVNGKSFTLVKFRNMNNATDENGNLLRADLRVTKWGKFVRATSLDELLNFYNIFIGDMSLIGPRPLPEVYRGRFNNYHELRHSVKPGLDCPLRDPSKVMTWANRLENDSWYAQNVSFKTDIKLIWLLVREVFFGKDKEARSEGFSEGTFMGYYEDGSVMDSNNIPEKYIEDYYTHSEE